jgi:hypothetical protein
MSARLADRLCGRLQSPVFLRAAQSGTGWFNSSTWLFLLYCRLFSFQHRTFRCTDFNQKSLDSGFSHVPDAFLYDLNHVLGGFPVQSHRFQLLKTPRRENAALYTSPD